MRFRNISNTPLEARVVFRFNGQPISAAGGQTIAAALLAAGHLAFRVSARDRSMHGPYCLMGACFECVVEIAGMGKCQACMTEAKEGMEVTLG